jgi:hypothetical protein
LLLLVIDAETSRLLLCDFDSSLLLRDLERCEQLDVLLGQ